MNKELISIYMPWFDQNCPLEGFEEVSMQADKYGIQNSVGHISELQDGDIVSIWDHHANGEVTAVYLGALDIQDNMGLFEVQSGPGYAIGLRDFFSPHENTMYIIEKKHKRKAGCECGARFTSFKNHHLDWCPQFNVAGEVK